MAQWKSGREVVLCISFIVIFLGFTINLELTCLAWNRLSAISIFETYILEAARLSKELIPVLISLSIF